MMINNFLDYGNQPFVTPTGIIDVFMFPAQRGISEFCVVMVLVCVPIMLLVKPCSAKFCPLTLVWTSSSRIMANTLWESIIMTKLVVSTKIRLCRRPMSRMAQTMSKMI